LDRLLERPQEIRLNIFDENKKKRPDTGR
jgi:hypothetical protein